MSRRHVYLTRSAQANILNYCAVYFIYIYAKRMLILTNACNRLIWTIIFWICGSKFNMSSCVDRNLISRGPAETEVRKRFGISPCPSGVARAT